MDRKADIRTSMKELFARMDEPYFMDVEGNVPMEMRDGKFNEDGWVSWKPVPSQITEKDIRELEETYGIELPLTFRSFLMAYHYVFLQFDLEADGGAYPGDCAFIVLPGLPVGQGLKQFDELIRHWSPLLSAGYIPFAFAEDDQGPICLNARGRREDGDYPVVWFLHEDIHHLGEEQLRIRNNLLPHVRGLFTSSAELLDTLLRQAGR
jgi:hypothetical protein